MNSSRSIVNGVNKSQDRKFVGNVKSRKKYSSLEIKILVISVFVNIYIILNLSRSKVLYQNKNNVLIFHQYTYISLLNRLLRCECIVHYFIQFFLTKYNCFFSVQINLQCYENIMVCDSSVQHCRIFGHYFHWPHLMQDGAKIVCQGI